MTELPYSYDLETSVLPFRSVIATVSSDCHLTIYTQSTAAFTVHNGEKVYITDEEKKRLDEEYEIWQIQETLRKKYEFSRLSQVE